MEEECSQAWLKILTTFISGNVEQNEMDVINGVVLQVREKHLRISLWCLENEDVPLLKSVGRRFKNMCGFDSKFEFHYQKHEKAIKHDLDNQSFVNI
jgi:hypothetical protein